MRKTLLTIAILGLLHATTAHAAPDGWRSEIEKALKASRFSANFEDAPLASALEVVGAFARVNLWLDREVLEERSEDELLVTLKADNIEVGSLLDLLTMTKGITYDLRWGGIFVSTRARLDSLPLRVKTWYMERSEENTKLLAKLEKKVNLDFAETPVTDVLNFLGSIGGVNIIFLPEAADLVNENLVTLKAADLSIEHTLAAVLLPLGLTYEIRDGVVMVRKAPENPDEGWIEAAKRVLARTKVSLEGGSFEEVLKSLDEKVPVPIVCDHALLAGGKDPLDGVKLEAREVSVKSALGLLTLSGRWYAWDYRWEAVFISTPERLELLPKNPLPPAKDPEGWERLLRRRLEEDVTLEFDSADVASVVEFLRQLKDLNIVFEPEARKAAEALPLTLKIENVALKNALALILYPRNLSYELKHEVIVIRKM